MDSKSSALTRIFRQAPPPQGGVEGASRNEFLKFLFNVNLIYLAITAVKYAFELARMDGLMIDPITPLGSDFVNLWATARLILEDRVETIYQPDAFMAYQQTFTHAPVGFRLWVYPPTSLLFAWPVGSLDYITSFAVWSLLGLGFLAYCARRFGFDWRETGILVLSPASLACIVDGQTSNLVTGLLLVALAPRSPSDLRPVLATALMTLKPQMGFLIPILWLRQGRWRLICWTAVAVVALLGLSALIFGLAPWSAYFEHTQPLFSRYLRDASGPYMLMYPSVFMATRNLGIDGDTAFAAHAIFALAMIPLLFWRLWNTRDANTQIALILIGTSLITPYLHTYDLTMLLVAGFLILRSAVNGTELQRRIAAGACLIVWISPKLTQISAMLGLPLMPLVLLGVFFAIRDPAEAASAAGGSAVASTAS
jgi:hypothetical protein